MQASVTQVMFYLLESENTATNNDGKQNSLFHHACMQASYFYRQKQKVFIYTENQNSAHDIDEMLWAFDPDSFVPHNLAGEGPSYGSAVEISWNQPTGRRPVLINLTRTVPDFAQQFTHIIDFVPTDETLKQQARDRFRAYRQLGCTVDNQPVPSSVKSPSLVTE